MRRAFRVLLIIISTVIGVFSAYVAWDELYRHIPLLNQGEYYNPELYNPINLKFLIPLVLLILSVPSILFHLRMYSRFYSMNNEHPKVLDLPELPPYLKFSNDRFRILYIGNLILGLFVLGFGVFILFLLLEMFIKEEEIKLSLIGISFTFLDLLFGMLILFDVYKNRFNFLKIGMEGSKNG